MEYLYSNECHEIIGACIEVQRNLGTGFLEPVYQEALELELAARGIPYEREKELRIVYKGQVLKKTFFADFVCYGKIILELKAVSEVLPVHIAQVLNYLNASGLRLGLIVNFAELPLRPQRVIK